MKIRFDVKIYDFFSQSIGKNPKIKKHFKKCFIFNIIYKQFLDLRRDFCKN